MDFKEYLKRQSQVQLSEIAFRMWPDNKTADNYLSKKLHGSDNRKWTFKDEKLARTALKELGIKLIDISKNTDIPKEDLTTKK